ncbi:tRNA (guanine-N(7)-)-methyltransferase non-catalytic subunit wdr4 isoform X1 [Belonocnema kinseyi]|uniref:tRNA (guanine-N(7)-)-methyltransferase non-catalytic subunit wdr4 isoform X1 n=1 Tax=Belonocnema kinseyi TaxID=2817044 RepID=UPI00143D341E|nr:tRNA (guanine-N(7)-)-methyltransferase non-catalytic subunit wdr4 isoform X1 [Belonocnema kinseyi]
MSFSIFDFDIALCSGENVVIYNIQENKERIVTLPKLTGIQENNTHNNEDIESFHALMSVNFSNDGEYLSICTNRKQLCLYKRKSLEIVSNRTLIRAASKVRFTKNNDIVVADKSGDAYLFSTSKPLENGTLLLGHLSMLLDILVTSDEKYIITADRDEKIRVSKFPNCYNIASYCLGHKKFVNNIAEVPHDREILVSCGGDGVFIFWNYKTGTEIYTYPFKDGLQDEDTDIRKLSRLLEESNVEESVIAVPVKQMQISMLNDLTSIISISLFCCKRVFIYCVTGKKDGNLVVKYLQSVLIEDEPLECHLKENRLWILTNENLKVYELVENSFSKDLEMTQKLEKLNESWKKLRSNASDRTLFPILYKRKFDNVQEYQERKKSRLIDKKIE